ncbi:lipid IV(A) 3-deoxy-D-manno-octulosonic acid transferase [Sessilibacter corallicola]|uniref:lipid IV(A) 3-deoxy-D-manno-octulosonic acid transferase n=1 Tax=Sessilibacter corallicola TaxID=2904075 RepID=UPI001E3B3E03|nr:lipid IV(A) 3-deoxy-D-manno-octulosonic acid transferase [Sessilibacter corallicola]MCE2030430.1 lipid IV(A) 3-deoxy-D-manno-octulosonic acid transferase [Sessilibacter corallicola]
MKLWQYDLIWKLALPLARRRLKKRAKLNPGYGLNIDERFGLYTKTYTSVRPVVWLHTVSVGEAIAAKPLIEWLLSEEQYQVLVTCSTPTGRDQLLELFADKIWLVYAPYDTKLFVDRFLDAFNPRAFFIMETELWPNLIRACRNRNIPVALLNGRLSEKSYKGYTKLGTMMSQMLDDMSLITVQYNSDGERFKKLGAAQNKVVACGSIKFDIEITDDIKSKASQLKSHMHDVGRQFIWIAASTHQGEDEIILAAHKRLLAKQPKALLILVPRHPERFQSVAELCSSFTTEKRSQTEMLAKGTEVLLGDTLGELMMLYGLADLAFVGGSLVENGGHNLIEPANWNLPLLSGPSLFNFSVISDQLLEKNALSIVNDSDELYQQLSRFLDDDLRAVAGRQSGEFALENRGALARAIAEIKPYLPAADQTTE